MDYIYPPKERADWDHARNRFTHLRDPAATWSHSVFSTRVDGYVVPNRDFPHQGLTGVVGGEVWKAVDALGLRAVADGEPVGLEPASVSGDADHATYRYEGDGCAVTATYRLVGDRRARVEVEVEGDRNVAAEVAVLADVRPVNGGSGEVEVREDGGCLVIESGGVSAAVGPGAALERQDRIDWTYKLDSGDRMMDDGAVVFREDTRQPVLVERLRFETSRFSIGVAFGPDAGPDAVADAVAAEPEEPAGLSFDTGSERIDDYLAARTKAMARFGTEHGNLRVPDAGDFWFREVWTRDLLFGLHENMAVYERMHGVEWVRDVLNWLALFREDGRLPERIGLERRRSVDADLLYLMAIGRFVERNPEFTDRFEATFVETLDAVAPEEGPLLRTAADQSWTDTYREVGGRRVSTRVPEEWVAEFGDAVTGEGFHLPELNAYWLLALDHAGRYGRGRRLDEAETAFRDVLWNDDLALPFNIALRDGDVVAADPTPTSMGVEAVTRLRHLFDREEVERTWATVEDRLLVERTPELFGRGRGPFGLLAKDSERVIFRGDEEYHEAVVWLRETVHLLELLQMLGKHDAARHVAVNVLDHQMAESGLLYSSELFALPEGRNPSPGKASDNPVPVKNPVQYWSQFVEPLLDPLGEHID